MLLIAPRRRDDRLSQGQNTHTAVNHEQVSSARSRLGPFYRRVQDEEACVAPSYGSSHANRAMALVMAADVRRRAFRPIIAPTYLPAIGSAAVGCAVRLSACELTSHGLTMRR